MNRNPSAFTVFEPDDGVFAAMYGTAQGWSIPTDIFNYANREYR